MTSRKDAIQAVQNVIDNLELRYPRYRGWLKAVDGSVAVSGKPGYVYVQRRDTSSGTQVEEVKMPDANVPDIDGFPVIIGRDPISREDDIVLRRDVDSYIDDLYEYLLRSHHTQHEAPEGFDVVYVQTRAVIPLRVSPGLTSGTDIRILAGWAPSLTGNNQYYNGETVDMSSYIPEVDQLFALISYDMDLNWVNVTLGETTGLIETLTEANVPLGPDGDIPLAAVMLFQGQTAITEDHIMDVRALIGSSSVYQKQFISMLDTPSTYTGQAGKFVSVNNDEDALIFAGTQDLDLDTSENARVIGLYGRGLAASTPSDGDVYAWDSEDSQWRTKAQSASVPRETYATTPRWHKSGAVSVANEIDGVWWVMQGFKIEEVYVYLNDTGSASSTIVDVDKSTDDGTTWTTIFTVQADRPELAAGGAKVAIGTPSSSVILSEKTLIRVNVDQAAMGASDLTVQLYGESGSAFGDDLTVLGVG